MPHVRATTPILRRPPRILAEVPRSVQDTAVTPSPIQQAAVYILLFAAFVAATAVGMRCMFDFRNGQPPLTSMVDMLPFAWAWQHLQYVADGLPFSLTLFAIFGAHRSGHHLTRYLLKRDDSSAITSLTDHFDASDRSRQQTRSRAETIAIGAAGPIAGFLVAVAAACYGLTHSASIAAHTNPSLLRISAPALIGILRSTMLASYPDIPPVLELLPHPVLIASWTGLLMTAFTLIPAGRLDGGHILYAISPRMHRIISGCSIAVILYLGTVEWIGWLFLALALIPPSTTYFKRVARTPLSVEWLMVVPLCLAIFLLTVSTQPIVDMSLTRVLLRIHGGF